MKIFPLSALNFRLIPFEKGAFLCFTNLCLVIVSYMLPLLLKISQRAGLGGGGLSGCHSVKDTARKILNELQEERNLPSRRFQFVWTLCNVCMRASEGAGNREKNTRYSRMSECNVYFYLFEHFGSINM